MICHGILSISYQKSKEPNAFSLYPMNIPSKTSKNLCFVMVSYECPIKNKNKHIFVHSILSIPYQKLTKTNTCSWSPTNILLKIDKNLCMFVVSYHYAIKNKEQSMLFHGIRSISYQKSTKPNVFFTNHCLMKHSPTQCDFFRFQEL